MKINRISSDFLNKYHFQEINLNKKHNKGFSEILKVEQEKLNEKENIGFSNNRNHDDNVLACTYAMLCYRYHRDIHSL